MNIIIVGAGIGGLSAAIALRQKGHLIRVLKHNQGLSEFGAGIQMAPNSVRLIYAWGLQEEFEKLAFVPRASVARRYDSGAVLGQTLQNPASMIDYGFPQIYRPDFQKLLADAAVKAGAKIEYGNTATEVDAERGSLILEDGTTITCDLIVCADDEDLIYAFENIEPIPFNEHNYRAIISRSDMMRGPEAAEMITSNGTQAILGPERAIICYPISAGNLFNLAIISRSGPTGEQIRGKPPIGRWSEPAYLQSFRDLFEDFSPSIKRLLSLVKDCTKWTIAELPPLKSWASLSGKAVLLGNSAHAMSPHAAQGSAMAIEDAAVLAECLSRFPGDIAAATLAYQSIREPRVSRIAEISRGNGDIWILQDGPDQEAGDRRFAAVGKKVGDCASVEKATEDKPKISADRNANWPSPELMMWIYGFDTVAEAKRLLGIPP